PRYALQRAMHTTALQALDDADVIIYLVDATDGAPEAIESAAGLERAPRAPVLVAMNKVDRLTDADRARIAAAVPDALFVSAANGDGVPELLAAAAQRLPESPFLYPDDEISTQNLRFFVAELIRETALEQLSDEVPYSIACEVEEFREEKSPVYIRAVLHVERDSQKRILIGAKGQQIRSIGQAARRKVESFLEQSVYLDLWVKVLPNWRKNAHAMARFGYRLKEEQR
ncbi:MAG: GTPase Era, partial [Gemmatimonadaceae bacterium]